MRPPRSPLSGRHREGTKRPAGPFPGGCPSKLKCQLQAELDVARTARPEYRVASVRRDVGDTESSAGSRARTGSYHGRSAVGGVAREICSVEEIEEFHSELCAVPLPKRPYFGYGKIHVVIVLAAEDA